MDLEILSFTFIIMAILYCILSFTFLWKFYTFLSSKFKLKSSIGFYIAILFALVSRSVTFTIIYFTESWNVSTTVETKYSTLLVFLLIFPDLIFMCVYLFFIWNFFLSFLYCHINLAEDIYYNENNYLSDYSKQNKKTDIGTYILMGLYILCFIILLILDNYDIIANNFLPVINGLFSLIIPILAIVYYIYLSIKFSGSPFKNEKLKSMLFKSFLVCIFWTISRITGGILVLLKSKFYIQQVLEVIYSISDKEFVTSIFFAISLLITELIPSLLTLNQNVIQFYILNTEFKSRHVDIILDREEYEDSLSNLSIDISRDNINSTTSNDKRNGNITTISHEFMLSLDHFKVINIMYPKRKTSFGQISKGIFNSLDVTIREIEFERISRYDVESFNKDIDEIMHLTNSYLNRIFGICFESIPKIFVIYHYQPINLHEFLHETKVGSITNHDISIEIKNSNFTTLRNKFGVKEKIQLCRKIALGIKFLHDNKIPHLHLSSKNILLDKKLNPKITDYGLCTLKEAASIFLNYKNKNSYSSPEILELNKTIGNSYFSAVEKSLMVKYLKQNISKNNQGTEITIKDLIKDKENIEEGKPSEYSINSYKDVLERLDKQEGENELNLSNLLSVQEELYKIIFKADIYSFGIIVWEIFNENPPFATSLKEVYKHVVESQLRPEIDINTTPEKICILLKKCWAQDYCLRASIDEVISDINSMEF